MNNLIDKLFVVFYPNKCLGCQKLADQKYFCKDCEGIVEPIKIKICHDCGQVLSKCDCKYIFYYFDEMISCFEADDNTKLSFYEFKFHGNYFGGKFFAEEMIKRVNSKLTYTHIDFITSVPPHKSSQQEKEYDQVKVLAKHISKATNIPFKRFLIQPKKVEKQHETKMYEDRFKNVKGKYSVKAKTDLKGKTILLVDDIKTSGATLSECARELKLSGANRVLAISALTVPPKQRKKVKLSNGD